jgi:hypothetical protein
LHYISSAFYKNNFFGEIFVKKLENHAKLGKKAAKRGKNVPKTAVNVA